ncbi:hypothetical protein G9C85_02990 [Halorubellus sp. JP-L1]|uniref:hypothetical protein n=1 Tax=Halorubellus sp. JP-L1 TaxID=2715753 RepID=UPI00140C4677|nr:hypothetical protein [Halorubellus sp. JP-L1]NHN40603.1 hypothetical protein [Halorubellus sp. JP-L1]
MSKVSIGLRGWRFDEDEVFTDDGDVRPFDEMREDTRRRLVRVGVIYGSPCDACWLIHGDDDLEACNESTVVYGEPLAEVTVCDEHEADFLYWFREDDGIEHAETDRFEDAFHEWFAAGNRAPEGYGGVEYVETDPRSLPETEMPDPDDYDELGTREVVEQRIDLRTGEIDDAPDPREDAGEDDDDEDDLDLDDADVDLDADYPS